MKRSSRAYARARDTVDKQEAEAEGIGIWRCGLIKSMIRILYGAAIFRRDVEIEIEIDVADLALILVSLETSVAKTRGGQLGHGG